ncbi:MAG: Uncharacterised protein [Cryomorphaceae bacterium]|nr:MAG: Uncharacterised protein [Cryomorphaceae bacterium]|tara:strand:- start:81 stop:491 length:411 start_codon:yes stop_codon:yes gene_type:complete
MKKILLIFIAFPFILAAQTDTTLNENKVITSVNEQGIDALFVKYENILKSKNGVEGWRVQLLFKAKQKEITQLKIDFIKLYPEIPTYLEYEAPYYRVLVGNFRTKLEAIKIKHQISKNFPGAYPVPQIINFSQLRK